MRFLTLITVAVSALSGGVRTYNYVHPADDVLQARDNYLLAREEYLEARNMLDEALQARDVYGYEFGLSRRPNNIQALRTPSSRGLLRRAPGKVHGNVGTPDDKTTSPYIHIIPKASSPQIFNNVVEFINVAGHAKKGKTNHWCLYLATGPKKSVRLDIIPSYSIPSTVLKGGSKANFVISDLEYVVSNSAEKVVRLDVPKNLKVGQIVDAIVRAKHHQYEFTVEGVGCRRWTTDQVDLLQKNAFLTNTKQADDARDAIKRVWPEGTALALDHGEYF